MFKKNLYTCFYTMVLSSIFLGVTQKIGYSPALLSALSQAHYELEQLALSDDALRHLIEYVEFYASWYAPLTPASAQLYGTLPDDALIFVERLKKIAQPLERKQRRPLLMGSSKLSDEGKLFYQIIISSLRTRLPTSPNLFFEARRA